jgi:hypothetical protein
MDYPELAHSEVIVYKPLEPPIAWLADDPLAFITDELLQGLQSHVPSNPRVL